MALAFLRLSFQVLLIFRTSWLTTGTTDCFCYTFNYTQKASWQVSRCKCEEGEGDLVTMETEDKWEFINSRIQVINEHPNEWHIGLEKKGEEWKWVNNQPLSIQKWQRDEKKGVKEPDGNGKCVAMAKNFPPGTQGLFKEIICSSGHFMYICEYRKGNPRCKDSYYPPRCNEAKSVSTSAKPTHLVTTQTTEPTQTRVPDTYGTQATVSTPSNKTNLAVDPATPTYASKNSSEKFPITLFVVAFVGILILIFIGLIIAVCFWKKVGLCSSRSKHKEDSQRNASEKEEETGIELNEVRTSSTPTPQNLPKIDAVIYAEIKDDHARSNPETSTYAEVHDCLSPCSAPAPEYLAPYEAVEQHKGPAYQPLNKKDSGEDDVALAVADYENAPNSASNNHNGVPNVEPDKQIFVSNAVYATVDKSMKKKSVQKQVEPVYAQVNKNGTTKRES